MGNWQFRLSLSIQLSEWNLATLLSAECALGETRRKREASGLEKDTKEMNSITGRIYLPIGFGRRRGHSRLPGPLRGGFSLRSCLGELGTHAGFFNKETQQIQGGNKEPRVGVTTGREAATAAAEAAAAAAAHTPEGGGSGGGEEDRTEPIKYTPDKKFLVEEIKKQQRRREGKG